MKKILLLLTVSVLGILSGFASTEQKLYASFETPLPGGTYENGVYTWTQSNNNTMTVFRFAEGELSNYDKLVFTTANLTKPASVDSSVEAYRVLFMGADGTTYKTLKYASAGTKTQVLSEISWDNSGSLAKVTEIRFAGLCNASKDDPGSVEVLAENFYLTTTKKNAVSGYTYALDLNDNVLNGASWDSETNTATWSEGSYTTNARYIRFAVRGDVAGAEMEKLTVTISKSTYSCRVFAVCNAGEESETWYNVKDGTECTSSSSNQGAALSGVSAVTKLTLDLSKVTSPIDYIMVKEAQAAGAGKTYTIDSVVFSKDIFTDISEDGLFFVNLSKNTTSETGVTADENGNYTITIDQLSGETMFYFYYTDSNNKKYYVHAVQPETSTENTSDNSAATDDSSSNVRRKDSTNSNVVTYVIDEQMPTSTNGLAFKTNSNKIEIVFDATGTLETTEYLTPAGVEEVNVEASDVAPVYYNLQGMRVDNPEHGIYIRCRGNKVDKVAL